MRSKTARSKRAPALPIQTEVAAFDGWKYLVVQVRPVSDPPAFQSWRIGIFERQKERPQMLGRMYHDTFEEARQACEKTLERAKKALGQW